MIIIQKIYIIKNSKSLILKLDIILAKVPQYSLTQGVYYLFLYFNLSLCTGTLNSSRTFYHCSSLLPGIHNSLGTAKEKFK